MSMAFAPGLPMVMAPVNMPQSGPNVGYSAVDPGYYYQSNVVSPLSDPYAGQGVGIYNDASMYRGGDFQGGGSDPFAGTIYAGGGGNGGIDPLTGEQTVYRGGGIGSDAGATGGHYENSYSYDGGVSNVWVPDTMGGQGYGFAPYPMGGGGGGEPYDSGIPPDTMGGQGFNQPQQQPSWADMWSNSGGRYPNQFSRPSFDAPPASQPWDIWPMENVLPDAEGGGGPGGIGSDALRDSMAWTLAQSSPYATGGIPSSRYPNLGYNPGMQNWFANPDMQQFDPSGYERQLQDILRGIDQGTGNQNLDPNWLAPGANGPGGRSYQGPVPSIDWFQQGG